jgi:hypothetical protein
VHGESRCLYDGKDKRSHVVPDSETIRTKAPKELILRRVEGEFEFKELAFVPGAPRPFKTQSKIDLNVPTSSLSCRISITAARMKKRWTVSWPASSKSSRFQAAVNTQLAAAESQHVASPPSTAPESSLEESVMG